LNEVFKVNDALAAAPDEARALKEVPAEIEIAKAKSEG
jgi:hypothetical protein